MWSSLGVKFKCPICNESFTVKTSYLLKKDIVVCSCCDYEFPNEVIHNVKESINYASKAFVHVQDTESLKKLEFDFLSIPTDN